MTCFCDFDKRTQKLFHSKWDNRNTSISHNHEFFEFDELCGYIMDNYLEIQAFFHTVCCLFDHIFAVERRSWCPHIPVCRRTPIPKHEFHSNTINRYP